MIVTCPKCGFTGTGRSLGKHVEHCTVTAADLFWQRINKRGPNGCWLFTGRLSWEGYGRVNAIPPGGTKAQQYQSHRYAWTLVRGPIPKGSCLLHKCDVRACVNPNHLYLGDRKQNMADAMARDRHARGERNSKAKLTPAQVLAIKAAQGSATQRVLAERYGVTQSAIAAIHRGASWKHLSVSKELPQLHDDGN